MNMLSSGKALLAQQPIFSELCYSDPWLGYSVMSIISTIRLCILMGMIFISGLASCTAEVEATKEAEEMMMGKEGGDKLFYMPMKSTGRTPAKDPNEVKIWRTQ